LGFAKSFADPNGFKGIKPKYLTTIEASGISKRYRLEKTAIAFIGADLEPIKRKHVGILFLDIIIHFLH